MLYIGSESGLQIKRTAGGFARPVSITGFAERTKEPLGQESAIRTVEIKADPVPIKYMILEITDEGSGFNKTA